MKKMNVVFAKKVIEVDAQFAKKASVYGTKEYNELVEVVKAFPGYKVITKRHGKKPTGLEMITERFIENYCTTHGDTEFLDNIERWKKESIDFEGYLCAYSFITVRNKFLEAYPEIKIKNPVKKTVIVEETAEEENEEICDEMSEEMAS